VKSVQALLRYLRQGRERVAEYSDTEISAEPLTIGSAPDRHIQLVGQGILPHHATIRRDGDQFAIAARGRARLAVNGKEVRSARLTVGDKVQIAGHTLTIIEAPAGFDLAISIELDQKSAKSEFEAAFRTDLDQTKAWKRRASWGLFVLIAVLCLGVPLKAALVHRSGAPTPAWLPDDTFWSAGSLIPAHALAVGRRCEACHQNLFVRVQDGQCRKCHDRTQNHVSVADLKLTELGPAARCGVCHEEHNAPDGTLVVRDDQLCVACHDAAHGRFGGLKVDKVSGFSADRHPPFKASLLVPTADLSTAAVRTASMPGVQEVAWHLQRIPVKIGREHSNLKFSHQQHLDVSRVQRLRDNAPLGCGDCHRLEPDGEHFIPITMKESCSACHELTFDDEAPQRQLPHGKPLDAILMIEDYYTRKFADPGFTVSTVARRRIPDQPLSPSACSGTPFVRGTCQANLEIVDQFTRRGCASCHVVTDDHSADVHTRFEVLPVRLEHGYFPDVHFSHRLHAVQKDLSGDAACLSCHKARDSRSSEDLLLPDIGKCQECHTDRLARDRVQLQCVNCHAYHSGR
jgi:predicted CXXCH cytochrome family protein